MVLRAMAMSLFVGMVAVGAFAAGLSGGNTTATTAPVFGPHPRMRHVVAVYAGDSAAATNARQALILDAERILAAPPEIPSEGGQWIFYYACPTHNATLHLKDGKHACPQCGKVYDDERTRLAYITLQYDRIDHDVLTLAKAWHVTRRDAFAAEIVRVFTHYARHYPGFTRHDRWGRFGILAVIGGRRFCQSLDEAVSIIKLAQAYDLVYDSPVWTPETRALVERDLFQATADTIYAFYLVADGRNNHMTWFNAGVANVAVALGRADLLDKAIHGAKGLRWQLDASVGAEGLWFEGTIAYHFYALQAVIETVHAARAGGWDLSADPNLRRMFLAPLRLAYPNGQLPALNDGDTASIAGYRQFYGFAAETWPQEPRFRQFAETGKVPEQSGELLSGAGLAYLRQGSGDPAVAAILDFGQHGGHHGHPDKLNLMLYTMGRELFLDPGRLTYSCPEYQSWTRQTVAHNTVVVDQESQRGVDGVSRLFKQGDGWSAVVGEASGVYPGTTLRRLLILTDRFLVDVFHVAADRSRILDWVLHGKAPLESSVDVEPMAGTLHDKAGYQHLTDLGAGDVAEPFYVDWMIGSGKRVRTHVNAGGPVRLVTGNGIGYQLTEKVPFILLRREGKGLDCVALHDWTGDGSLRVTSEADRSGRFHIRVQDGARNWRFAWDAADRPESLEVDVKRVQ